MQLLSRKVFERPGYLTYLQPLIILVFGVANLLWGELLPVHGGFGWDGRLYKTLTRDYQKKLAHKSIESYYLQRLLPSVVVRYSLRLAHARLTDRNILLGFRVYDSAVLVLAAWAWVLIMDCLGLSYRDKWLGFTLLFFNFAVLKQFFYAPVATDQTAFALATLTLLFFLRNNALGLFLSLVAAAYTWPLLMLTGLLLYLFPRKEGPLVEMNRSHSVILATFLALAFGAAAARAYFIDGLAPLSGATPIVAPAIWISIAVACVYIFSLFRVLLSGRTTYPWPGMNFRELLFRFGSAGLLLAGVSLISALLSRPTPSALLSHPIELIGLSAIARPGIFILAHVVYWGPAVLLAAILWRRVAEKFRRYGAGLFLFAIVGCFLTLGAESRQWLSFFPFLIAMTTCAIAELSLPTITYWFIAGLSLLYSKVWFPINPEMWVGGSDPLQFPLQYLFMNLGPWMSNQMYLEQGAMVIITALALYFTLGIDALPWRASNESRPPKNL